VHRLFILAASPVLVSAASPPNSVEIQIENVRSIRGQIHACATRTSRHFPDCSKDPHALRQSVRAGTPAIRFSGFVPGRYAVTLIHDENANRRLDMFLGIPREGFGFSRNPVVRFGAPRFSQVDIALDAGFTRATVRMQYLL